MQAMLESLVAKKQSDTADIFFLHACENVAQHSFKKRQADLAQQGKVINHIWYKSESAESALHGFMDISTIADQLPLIEADFYLCGPVSFMQFAKQQLVTLGVENDCIHYEVFGPHESF